MRMSNTYLLLPPSRSCPVPSHQPISSINYCSSCLLWSCAPCVTKQMVFTSACCCPKDAPLSPHLLFPSSRHWITLHSIASLRLSPSLPVQIQNPRRAPLQIALAPVNYLSSTLTPEFQLAVLCLSTVLVLSLTQITSAYQTQYPDDLSSFHPTNTIRHNATR